MDEFEDMAKDLALALSTTSAELDRTGELPRENLERAAAAGVLALTVPRELGGLGADLHQFARYQERLSRGDGATALILAMHHMLIGGEAEARLWPPDSFAEVCRAVREEGALINASSTEPGAGSPSMGGLPQTTAEPEDPAARDAPLSRWRI